MKFKGTASLFVLLVVLAAWVHFTDVRGREGRNQVAEDAKKALPIDDEEISEISIIYPDHTITGIRSDAGWNITSPPGMEADSEEWDLLASNVPRIEREGTVLSEDRDLEQYGLASPALRVTVGMSDGATHEVLFGNENPRKIYNYAKLGDSDEVFLAPSSWLRIFRKEVNDLRGKVVLAFEQDDIDRIEITGMNRLMLDRIDESWVLAAPIEKRADEGEVSTFLGAVNFARASGFADEGVDSSAAGFDEPSFRIVLHNEVEDKDHVLLLGREAEEADKYFARDEARDTIFIVDDDILERARRPLFDWRDKAIASFDRDEVFEIELSRDEERLVLRRSGDDWILPDGRKAKLDKVSGMFNALEFERSKEIIDSPGPPAQYALEVPRLEVVLRGDGEEVLRFSLGADIDDPDGVYWKSAHETAVRVVSKDVFDRFNVTTADLIEDTEGEQ
jgi:hypothetical protein